MPEQLDFNNLRSVSLFRDLDKNEMEVVCKQFFEQIVKKDSILFVEGSPGAFLYIVSSGRVEIIKKTKDNEEIVLATMGANEVIGEMSLIDAEPRTATARTSEDSVLLVITKQKFNEILQSDPRIAAKILMGLLKVINKRLRIMDKKLEEIK